jgi:lambda family phage portal protein
MAKKKKSKTNALAPTGDQIRQYAGATRDPESWASDWVASSTSADAEIWSSLRTLRDRSRGLCRDSDYAIGAVRSILTNVLGKSGIRMQSKVKGADGEFDSELNKNIEAAWKLWQNPDYCDVAGQIAWPQIERLALRSIIESGEVLIRMHRRKFGDSPIPFALEIIESDQLCDQYSVGLQPNSGNTVTMGVERDQWKRPVAYWITPSHPGDFFSAGQTGKSAYNPVRIPAREIIHLYLIDRPGQSRGVPWLSAAIERLRGLGEYSSAEITKARLHACAMGFIESDAPQVGLATDTKNKRSRVKFQPGQIANLAAGEKFAPFAPTSPNNGLDPFMRFLLRGVSAGIGVPSDAVSQDYSQTTYGGQRAAMLDARDFWAVLQEWLWSGLHQHVFEGFVEAAMLSAELELPDFELRYREYSRPSWMARGWSWIDPSKDINASISAVKSGLSTVGMELASQGLDFDEVLEQRKAEVEKVKAAGMQYESLLETMVVVGQGGSAQNDIPVPPVSADLTAVRSVEPGSFFLMVIDPQLTLVRPLDGLRGKTKKCKAKPCGASCIAMGDHCLHGLSASQKKLAKEAKAAMDGGGIGKAVSVVKPVDKPKTPRAPKAPKAGGEPKPKTPRAPKAPKTEGEAKPKAPRAPKAPKPEGETKPKTPRAPKTPKPEGEAKPKAPRAPKAPKPEGETKPKTPKATKTESETKPKSVKAPKPEFVAAPVAKVEKTHKQLIADFFKDPKKSIEEGFAREKAAKAAFDAKHPNFVGKKAVDNALERRAKASEAIKKGGAEAKKLAISEGIPIAGGTIGSAIGGSVAGPVGSYVGNLAGSVGTRKGMELASSYKKAAAKLNESEAHQKASKIKRIKNIGKATLQEFKSAENQKKIQNTLVGDVGGWAVGNGVGKALSLAMPKSAAPLLGATAITLAVVPKVVQPLAAKAHALVKDGTPPKKAVQMVVGDFVASGRAREATLRTKMRAGLQKFKNQTELRYATT